MKEKMEPFIKKVSETAEKRVEDFDREKEKEKRKEIKKLLHNAISDSPYFTS